MRLKTLIVAVCVSKPFHNGSIFPNSLPLRKEEKAVNAAQDACGGGVRFRVHPQRQRFPQFTAVAEGWEEGFTDIAL